jgi:hypothetical protein
MHRFKDKGNYYNLIYILLISLLREIPVFAIAPVLCHVSYAGGEIGYCVFTAPMKSRNTELLYR